MACDTPTLSRSGPAPTWCVECKSVVRRANGRLAARRYDRKKYAEDPAYRADKVTRADAWRRANIEASRTYQREWARTEKAKTAGARRRATPKGQAAAKAARERNRVAMRPARRRSESKRRAAKRGSAVVVTVDPLVVLERDDGVCGICGADVDPMNFHVDHIRPLARGGNHSYANVQTAHPSCNVRKHVREGWTP
jgi:5-methylcytosine-specific restriction endonuclease McrA